MTPFTAPIKAITGAGKSIASTASSVASTAGQAASAAGDIASTASGAADAGSSFMKMMGFGKTAESLTSMGSAAKSAGAMAS